MLTLFSHKHKKHCWLVEEPDVEHRILFLFFFKLKHLVFTRSKFHSYLFPKTDITANWQFIFVTQNWTELCFFLISDMLLSWLNYNIPTGDGWKEARISELLNLLPCNFQSLTYHSDHTVFVSIPDTDAFPHYSIYFPWSKALLSHQITCLLSSDNILGTGKKFSISKNMPHG